MRFAHRLGAVRTAFVGASTADAGCLSVCQTLRGCIAAHPASGAALNATCVLIARSSSVQHARQSHATGDPSHCRLVSAGTTAHATCQGLLNAFGSVCCLSECGVCGGTECASRLGGRRGCCVRRIEHEAGCCVDTGGAAPCRMPSPLPHELAPPPRPLEEQHQTGSASSALSDAPGGSSSALPDAPAPTCAALAEQLAIRPAANASSGLPSRLPAVRFLLVTSSARV